MQKDSSTSSIQVYVRVRPLVTIQKNTDKAVQVLPDNRTVSVNHDSYNHLQIKFDQAFDHRTSQDDIYSHFTQAIPRVITGYNVTIFAYGQTGSGKTYTMFGNVGNQESREGSSAINVENGDGGVIPRAIRQIFGELQSIGNASVFCSFLQIYNEKIYDLLQDTDKPKALSIHQSKAEGIFVQGLTQFGVQKASDCAQLLSQGLRNRVIRQTSMNAKSSRSHSIFQLLVQIQQKNGIITKGRLNLCDLAGSEKINKKEAMGDAQMKQLKNINLSLTTLGKVIYALSSGDKKTSGAFRQSKLTRLLQQSLTGNTFTFVMANLSPSTKNLQQTVNTLKFVQRANHITLKVKPTSINSNNPDAVLKLKKEVQYLKQLLDLKKQGVNPEEMPQHLQLLLRENDELKQKIVPEGELKKMALENREMKKEIHNLQVRLEQTEGTETSLASQYMNIRNKQAQNQRYKQQYYKPSSRAPSSRNSSNSNQKDKLSNSLVKAGQSIVFNKLTIDDTPNRQQQKKNIARRLQQMEDRKKHEEYRLIQDYQMFDRKSKPRYSPPKNSPGGKGGMSGKREESYSLKNKKKVDYSDRIKELEARLFKK